MLIEAHAATTSSLRHVDFVARARAREIAEVINAGTQPLQNLSHLKTIKSLVGEAHDEKEVAKAGIVKGLTAVERLVCANRDPRFCVGSQLSIADLCVVPQLYNARRFGADLALFPRILAIEEHVSKLPCFVAAHPGVQPDAQP